MNGKKATSPNSKAAPKQASNDSTICTLGSYEKRCLERLLQGCCERPHLDRYIGTTNSPEFIKRLRRKSLDIVTNKVSGINRDGRYIWWGRYCLAEDTIPKAKQLLGIK